MDKLKRPIEPYETTIRTRFEEVDSLQVVWFGNYFKYFGVSQIEWWRAAGFPPSKFEELGIRIAVLSTSANYYKSAKFDDLLTVQTNMVSITKTKLTMFSKILLNNEVLADNTTHFFCTDLQGNLRRYPDNWIGV